MLVALSSIVLLFLSASVRSVFQGFKDVHTMPIGRSDQTVTIVNVSGVIRMYANGGCIQDQLCKDSSDYFSCYCPRLTKKCNYYMPKTNEYVTNVADAPRERYRHASAAISGKIYLLGGRDVNDTVVTAIDAYEIATDKWTTPCTWENATSDLAAFADGNDIYVVGGYAQDYLAMASAFHFDPNDCSFTPKGSMASGRGDISSISLSNTRLQYVVGGFANDPNDCNALNKVESFNPVTGLWTSHSPLTKGRADCAIGELGVQMLVIAGETVSVGCNRSIPVTNVERFIKGANETTSPGSWIVETSIPDSRFRFVAGSYGNTIFLFGGQGRWTENLNGSGMGGFPIIRTVTTYVSETSAASSSWHSVSFYSLVITLVLAWSF
eukprot:gb/GEZN01009755.1/.p1 GENE.gb/GEZN01009755.1/~~gb/GEZN01009755.1/.p1  ORF type:complete len:381 (+),score=15.83 gb/GEZN01009755.1/:65-1207(+)